jgi:hypothetical protein
MGKVAIRCPHTALVVETGWIMPQRVLRQSVAFAAVLQPCPACAQSHEWTAEDAWVIEPPIAPDPACEAPREAASASRPAAVRRPLRIITSIITLVMR